MTLASFNNPYSRQHDIFGDCGQLVDDALFLSDDLILVNFMTFENLEYFQDNYWTIMEAKNGQIKAIDDTITTLNNHKFHLDDSFTGLASGETSLIFRKGLRKQEEKRITLWDFTGKTRKFDTAERLRKMETE